MKIETKYLHEKTFSLTSQSDLLKIIAEEVGDADPEGTLIYIKEVLQAGKEITVGSCKFRKHEETK